MEVFALGINHVTAPIAVRERFAFQPNTLIEALLNFKQQGAIDEAAILSTCNRTELYFSANNPERAAHWLADYHQINLGDVYPYLYSYPERQAVRHVFRVASGLDSMVVGEPQILGQVKTAVQYAQQAGTMGTLLHKLFQNTFLVAKQVRSTTDIGVSTISMAAATVQLADRVFGDLSEQSILLIGAGEMIELCAAHFASAKPKKMVVANRTHARAFGLADRYHADTMNLGEIADNLAKFDVIISCTASPLPIVGLGMVEKAAKIRRHRPMVMVDLAVPRDIESQVSKLDDVFLYTVDDLSQIVNNGMQTRRSAMHDAEEIINRHVERFFHWLESRNIVPTIVKMRDHAEKMRVYELEKALRLLENGNNPKHILEQLSYGLLNKMMHSPISYLNNAEGEQKIQASQLLKRLYNLDDFSH